VWEHGEPTGPFLACETGSGFLFRSVAIGWCMHNGAGWKEQGCTRDAKGHCWGGDAPPLCPSSGPTHISPLCPTSASGRVALTFGARRAAVCSVECSVSGQFFASLPCVELRKGPERFDPGAEDPEGPHGGPATTLAVGAEWCLRHLSYRDGGGGDTSLTVTATNNRCDDAHTLAQLSPPRRTSTRTSRALATYACTLLHHLSSLGPSRVTLSAWRCGRRGRMDVSGWECAEAGTQQDLRIILCPKPQSPSHSQSPCATASAPAAQQQLKVAGAEPDAAESAAEEEAAAETEATRCSLGEEPEIAALYGDAPNHLHVLGWTPAAEAGFEVVVLLHGWASPVQWGVQVCAVATAGTCHMHMPYMHTSIPCTNRSCAGSSSRWRAFPRTSSR
jgi:hypothetical protein